MGCAFVGESYSWGCEQCGGAWVVEGLGRGVLYRLSELA